MANIPPMHALLEGIEIPAAQLLARQQTYNQLNKKNDMWDELYVEIIVQILGHLSTLGADAPEIWSSCKILGLSVLCDQPMSSYFAKHEFVKEVASMIACQIKLIGYPVNINCFGRTTDNELYMSYKKASIWFAKKEHWAFDWD